MKIFRITQYNDPFWRAVTNIGGVDVIHIDADYHIRKNAVNRITDEHFITYDKKDMHKCNGGFTICCSDNVCASPSIRKLLYMSRLYCYGIILLYVWPN